MILPVCQPKDYSSVTIEYLQLEITWCDSMVDLLETIDEESTQLPIFKDRLKLAEEELEKRFLLS